MGGVERMISKQNSDHAAEPDPKPCANVDGVRCVVTYEDVEGMRRGLKALSNSFEVLRMKNTFSPEHNPDDTFGYRSWLVNILYKVDGCTWGDALDDPRVQALWTEEWGKLSKDWNFGLRLQEGLLAKFEQLQLHKGLRARPLVYVGEVQFIFKEYLLMRQKSHF